MAVIFHRVKISFILAILSNATTDSPTRWVNNEYLDMGLIRFHAQDTKGRAIRREGKNLVSEDAEQDPKD